MPMSNGDRQAHVEALLDNGEIVAIDNAHETKDIYDPESWVYLGAGVYHAIDGKKSSNKQRMHFWKKKKPGGMIMTEDKSAAEVKTLRGQLARAVELLKADCLRCCEEPDYQVAWCEVCQAIKFIHEVETPASDPLTPSEEFAQAVDQAQQAMDNMEMAIKNLVDKYK